jgi:hypothetical protein
MSKASRLLSVSVLPCKKGINEVNHLIHNKLNIYARYNLLVLVLYLYISTQSVIFM